jgi:hypothetical protein
MLAASANPRGPVTLAEGRKRMRRSLSTLLALSLLALAAWPAAAREPKPREIERLALKLERLFQPLGGEVDSRDLVVRKLRSGLYSLSYPLPASKPIAGVNARRDDDKVLRTLSCGHMLAEPLTPASVVTAVVSNIDTGYFLWWAAVNQGELDEVRMTSVKVSGPEGFDLEVIDEVPYLANSVTLFFFNPFEPLSETEPGTAPFSVPGVYTHRVIVRGAGKAYYRFWVEPLSTTPVER